MNLTHPLEVICGSLETKALEVLAGSDAPFSIRQVQRMIGDRSYEGVRKALDRLRRQGLVIAEPIGTALMYRINREHLAAPYVQALATLRQEVFERLKQEIRGWLIKPVYAAVFGSTARRESGADSDVDIFVLRPKRVEPDDPVWQEQLAELSRRASAWTGNDVRILEYDQQEVTSSRDQVLGEIAGQGIPIAGDPHVLKRLSA
jgi:predicted nucleotidyltransferase